MRPAADAPRQLALPFVHEPHFAAADFLSGDGTAAAVAWLAPGAEWPQRRLALWGPEGCGKTHLLHIWAERTGAGLLAGHALPAFPCDPTAPLAIDEADAAEERPLLHLLNAWAEAGQPVLLAAREAPARWPVALPDLGSRLRAVTAVPIRSPDDALLRSLLARLLAERQLAVAEPVQDWLRLRLPRTPGAMREAAARLDHAALAAGRRVSRAIAADVLRSMAGASANHEDFTRSSVPISQGGPCLL